MCNSAFAKLMREWDANYKYNDKFKEYVDSHFYHHTDIYGEEQFKLDDMKEARKFWKQNAKKHPNYPWFADYSEAYDWIDNMPFGGYEY